LSVEEAARRLEDGMDRFDTAAEALVSIAASGITLVEDAEQVTVDLLDDDEFSFAVPFILQVILALVPPGHRAPPTSLESLERLFNFNENGLYEQVESNKRGNILPFLLECPQPNLMLLLTNQILKMFNTSPKDFQLASDAQPIILALIKSIVEELDRVLRP
jgi:hypothetical protein